jgi:hypothetical protein
MITEKTIISGTEEELLEYFKKKYNLVKYEYIGDCEQESPQQDSPKQETVEQNTPDTARGSSTSSINPAVVGNKVSTGFSGLFDGTSWGKN